LILIKLSGIKGAAAPFIFDLQTYYLQMTDTISSGKSAQPAQFTSGDLLQLIVEHLPLRVFWKDTESRYMGCNAVFAHDAGLSRPEDLIGKDDFKLAWREQAELYRADDRQVMDSGQPKLGYEEPQTGPDGRQIWIRTSKVPLHNHGGTVIGMLGIFEDITEQKLAKQELNNASRALRAISVCNEALFRAVDENELLNAVCRLIVNEGGYRMVWIGYSQEDSAKSVRPVAQYGYDDNYLSTQQFSWSDDSEFGRGPTGTSIRTGTVQVNQNFITNPQLAPWREAARQHSFQSSIALPLKSGTGTLGALMIYAEEADAFSEHEVSLLKNLAADLAYGIETLRTRTERNRIMLENQRQAAALLQSLKDFIKAIASTVEMRDPYTAGHQQRTGHLAEAIARELGLPEKSIEGIALAAVVHDLGKISVPTEILCKPGRLSDMEYMLIKVHPQTGYEILKDIQFPWPIATIVWQHHERMDGSGYPQGLKGDQILIESRVMAVADVIEAMASHRPYRPALGVDIALKELERGRGTIFDAPVVDACLTLFRNKKLTIPA